MLCQKCVKAKWRGTKVIGCRVLKKIIPNNCWAFSDDPDFWVKLEKAVNSYAEMKTGRVREYRGLKSDQEVPGDRPGTGKLSLCAS